MNSYNVAVDITLCKMMSVEAESEQEAMDIASKMIESNPYEYTNNFSHYVTHEVVEAYED